MSKEATLRRAVESEYRPYAYLSLQINKNNIENFLETKYSVHSQSFIDKIGMFSNNQSFSKQHEISKVLTDPIKKITKKHVFISKFGKKEIELKTEVWYNGYNVLALFKPNE